MRKHRLVALFVLFLQLAALPAPALARGWRSSVSETVEVNAGGWGLATPLMIAGVGIYQHLAKEDEFEARDLLNRKVLGGLAGDFLTVAAFSAIAPALPLSPLLRNYFVMLGGFVGWEIGSGNLPDTDWVSVFAQAGAATLTQSAITAGMASMGLAMGPIATTALPIVAALVTASLLGKLRGEPAARASDRAEPGSGSDPPGAGPAAALAVAASSPGVGGSSTAVGPAAPSPASGGEHAAYRNLIAALRSGDPAAQAGALAAYRRARE